MTYLVGLGQHSLIKLEYPVNTDHLDEICPVVTYDQSTLYFTRVADPNCEKTLFIDSVDVFSKLSEKDYFEKLQNVYSQIASKPILDPYASSYNQDIWYTKLVDNAVEGIFHPGYPINDALPNSICSNYGMNDGFLVINQFVPHGGIEKGFSFTQRDEDSFTFPQAITVQTFQKISAGINATVSIDSMVMILSMAGADAVGDMDLYVCFRSGSNVYSAPINIGQDINSPFRESTPMISHDLKRLYFTSDRPGGFGGTDIYFADRLDFTFTKWSTPQKLNPPVNTEFDDSHPHLIKDNDVLYFTSNRDGSSDIFQVRLNRSELVKPLNLTINIISSVTGQKCGGELVWGNAYGGVMDGFFRSRDGLCKYKFFKNKAVAFKATNRNLQSDVVIVDAQELLNQGITDHIIELVMYPDGRVARVDQKPKTDQYTPQDKISEIDLNLSVMLNNIYFERAKPDVLLESYPSIQKLADVLLTRPRLYIKIIGHTDNLGAKHLLKKLSEDRANAIKELLVQRGVPAKRIDTYGYGDSKPLAPNDTEENKSKNRRVEIQIISQ